MAAGCLSRVRLDFQCLKNSRDNKDINRLNRVSASTSYFLFFLLGLLLLLVSTSLAAQILDANNPKHVHGSVVTGQGKPIADATVEIRDLHGIQLGKVFTDAIGNFEISAAMIPGQYILLAAKEEQAGDTRISFDQKDLTVRITFPATSEEVGPKPPGETVSVKQLSISAKAWARMYAAHKDFSRMNLTAAMKEIDGALRSDPDCAPAFSMRAFIKLAATDLAGAVEDARHAIFLDPDEAESYLALGTAYNSLRAFAKAEEAVRHALKLRPDSWQSQIEMAKSLYGQEQFVLALRELEAISRDFPDVHLVRGDVLMRLDRRTEATEQFRVFLNEAPDDPRKEQIQRIIASERQAVSITSQSLR
jgi:Tfp pilus assembly protein PilF